MRIAAAVVALVALLTGCAGQSEVAGTTTPAVTGNQSGGKIPGGVNDMPASMAAASAHCMKFNKKAQITQMAAPSEGAMMAFECR
jgi:hypothetical protein